MKKFMAILLAACLLAGLLAGCGGSKASTSVTSSTTKATTKAATAAATTAATTAAQTETAKKAPALSGLVLTYAQPYSEGLAWVQYQTADKKTVTSVVDTEGNIVFSLPDGVSPSCLGDFQDGHAFYRVASKETGKQLYEQTDAYDVIVDKTGKETYRTGKAAGVKREFLFGHANGVFAAVRYTQGIEKAVYSLGTLHADGTVADEFSSDYTFQNSSGYKMPDYAKSLDYYSQISEYADYPFSYLGEGWYQRGGTNIQFSSHVINTTAEKVCQFRDGLTASNSITDLLIFDKTLQQVELRKDTNIERSDIADGIYFNKHAYYNLSDGSEAIAVAEYPDNQIWCSPFYDGYAAMVVFGADKTRYLTVIDRQGKKQFEPIAFERTNATYLRNYVPEKPIVDGYLMAALKTDDWKLIDMKGNIVHSLSGDFGGSSNISVSDGGEGFALVKYGNSYKFYPVAAAAKAGTSVYDLGALKQGETGTSSAGKQTTTAAARSYTTVKNFKIEGKWKSTGTYGFGQAQPGAIVAFDGTKCNFFSPSDTYALTASGSSYELDVTSFGSTDTLRFTVKTVDKDHIDVTGSGGTTELTRVG